MSNQVRAVRLGSSRGRGPFQGNARVRGVLFVVGGLFFFAVCWPMFALSAQLTGHPGTLTVSSCALGVGSHPVITCTGSFQLKSGGPVYHGASVEEQVSYPAGARLTVQQGSGGSLAAVSVRDLWGLGAILLLAATVMVVGAGTLLNSWRRRG